jgi:hypothetical protein
MATIIALGGEFASVKELKQYSDAQYVALQGATEKIKKLEEEITHLQTLLVSTTSLIENPNKISVIKSPEQAIVEAQIEILQNRALTKELTLEEIKALDILIKNKRLLAGDPTTIEGKDKKPKREYTEAELVRVARIEDRRNGEH